MNLICNFTVPVSTFQTFYLGAKMLFKHKIAFSCFYLFIYFFFLFYGSNFFKRLFSEVVWVLKFTEQKTLWHQYFVYRKYLNQTNFCAFELHLNRILIIRIENNDTSTNPYLLILHFKCTNLFIVLECFSKTVQNSSFNIRQKNFEESTEYSLYFFLTLLNLLNIYLNNRITSRI